MLKYLALFMLIFSSAYAELSRDLVKCDQSCECPSPYLPIENTFKTFKSSERLAQCGLDLSMVLKNLTCLQALGLTRSQICAPEGAVMGKVCFDESPLPATYQTTFKAPKNCGYKWRGFSLYQYKQTVERYIATDKINCGPSMCTSAAFLALVAKAKELYQSGEISPRQFRELTVPQEKGYMILNSNAEPNTLVESFGIGTGHTQYIADKELGKDGVPVAGDLVQIWRSNGSGHSVVFKGFVDENNDGVPEMLCYWSSQTSTEGYGDRCETTDDMDRVLVGHFK